MEHAKEQQDERIVDLKKSVASLSKLKAEQQQEVSELTDELLNKKTELRHMNDSLSHERQKILYLESRLEKGMYLKGTIVCMYLI